MPEMKEFPDGGVWDTLRSDDVYSEFLKQSYDETTTSQVAVGLNIAEHLRKLNECISLIDTEIHNQVAVHHGDLLSHATGIETLEDVLKMLHTRISSLLASLSRVKTRAGDAHARISGLTRQLARMQFTCDIMRKTARVLYLRRKLTSQIPVVGGGGGAAGISLASGTSLTEDLISSGGSADLSAAAANLFELKQLLSDEDLRGIDVIEEDRTLAKKAWKEVESRGMGILESGMSTPNQSQIASALQVFSNMDIVELVADKVVLEAVEKIDKAAVESLNLHNLVNASSASAASYGSGSGTRVAGAPPGRAVMPIPGNVTAFRATLWTNLEKLMNIIFVEFQRMANLKIVVDQQNAASNAEADCSSSEREGNVLVKEMKTVNILKEFWVAVIVSIGKHFQTASNASYVAAAFEAEFPKLLRFFNDLWSRVDKFQAAVGCGGRENGRVRYEEEMKEAALKRFRDAYLARALSRLLDPINLMFAPSDSDAESPETPSSEEVENVIKALQQELVVGAFDVTLVREVCEIISKCIRNFTAKCELMIVENEDSMQVIGPANTTQLSNAKVANSLFFFSEGIGKVLSAPSCSSIPTVAMQIVCEANEELLTLMHSGILPLLKNVEEMIEKVILTMHNEDFSSQDKNQIQSKRTNSSPSSLYMRELNDFLSRVSSDYFGLFDCLEVLRAGELKRIATRTIHLFVRHAALVRPLGDGGRMRLATDFAAFEAAISPLLAADSSRGGLASLGKPYRLLRACKSLLFAEEDQVKEIAKGGIVDGDLLLLFLFGRGPSDLRSPHQTMGWTEVRYSQWVDDHPQLGDRLELTRGALEAYQQLCRKKRVKEYATVYPLIVDLLNHFGEPDS